jgi:hypothetical protein
MPKIDMKCDDVAALLAAMARVRDLCERLDLPPLVDVQSALMLVRAASERGTEEVKLMMLDAFGDVGPVQ